MARELKIELFDILELISCAEDWGFVHDVLFDAFAEMLEYPLSDEDIESYSRSIEALKGYGAEAYKQTRSRLIEFKKKYIESAGRESHGYPFNKPNMNND